jgi:SAM-dependent methyltransferase
VAGAEDRTRDRAAAPSGGAGINSGELQRRLAAFPDWLYEIELGGGVRTPVANRVMVNRQRERRRYFFEALLSLTGGSLSGRSVLDLGCGAGYWSLAALDAGAQFVLAVDAAAAALEQTRLVLEARGIAPSRYELRQGNAVEHSGGGFAIVLCLGLLTHVARPLDLFAAMARADPELIVIDTEVSRERLPVLEMARPYGNEGSSEYPFLLVPSPAAVADMARHFGYRTLALAPRIEHHAGMGDYRRKRRLAFICHRGELPANDLVAEPQRRLVPWWLRDPGALREALL